MKNFNKPIPIEGDEELILEVRHFFGVFIPHLMVSFLIVVIDFFLLFVLFKQGTWGVLIFLLVLFIALFYIVRVMFFWFKNRFIITSNRIIDYERLGFFNKKVSEITLDKVRDVSYSSKGFWQHLLKYGNIRLQLIHTETPLILYNIKDPEDIQQLINEKLNNKGIKKIEDIDEDENEDNAEGEEIPEILEEINSLDKESQKEIYYFLKKKLFSRNDKKPEKSKKDKKNKDKFLEDYWKEESI